MHNDPHINILWLSDIHYHGNYVDKNYHPELKKYLDSFHAYTKTFDVDFDYILLSGDIAQEGVAGDYELFDQDILNDLQANFPNASLMVIPGNHDLSRDNLEFVNEYITSKTTAEVFFKKHKTDFFDIFLPYTEHFKANQSIATKSSAGYKKNVLYGHILDIEKKVIIILLNSAWYSFGETFLRLYIDKKQYLEKDAAQLKEEILKITIEYGSQLLALEMLEEIDALLILLERYPEFLVITSIHHPTNWLNDAHQRTTVDHKFHTIKSFTDVLITGHEHVHLDHPFEYINDNKMLHLKAGCFVDFSGKDKTKNEDNDDNFLKPFKIRNNWFSTLSINTKKRTLTRVKHNYDLKSGQFIKHNEKYSLMQLNKKHEVNILGDRLDDIKAKLSGDPHRFLETIFPDSKVTVSKLSGMYQVGNDGIIFLQEDKIDFPSDILKEFFKQGGNAKLYVVLVDLFNNLAPRYIKETNRLIVLNDIKNNYDLKFDKFRHNFFSKLSDVEVPIYGNLIFLNRLKPYWDVET